MRYNQIWRVGFAAINCHISLWYTASTWHKYCWYCPFRLIEIYHFQKLAFLMCLHRFLEIVHLQKLAFLMCLYTSGKSDSIITLGATKLSNEWAVCIWQHEYNQDPISYFKQKVNCSANIWLISRAELEWIFLVFRWLLHHPNVFLSWMWWSLYVWIKAS